MRWARPRSSTEIRHLTYVSILPAFQEVCWLVQSSIPVPRSKSHHPYFIALEMGFAWNYNNGTQSTCQTINPKKNDLCYHRRRTGGEKWLLAEISSILIFPFWISSFILKLWAVTNRADAGLLQSNKTAEQSLALSFFAKHTNTFWIDKTSILKGGKSWVSGSLPQV